MRENRPYGSEGGEGEALPDPYHYRAPMRPLDRANSFRHSSAGMT
jgi:hypothetical protein